MSITKWKLKSIKPSEKEKKKNCHLIREGCEDINKILISTNEFFFLVYCSYVLLIISHIIFPLLDWPECENKY